VGKTSGGRLLEHLGKWVGWFGCSKSPQGRATGWLQGWLGHGLGRAGSRQRSQVLCHVATISAETQRFAGVEGRAGRMLLRLPLLSERQLLSELLFS
jgi:hypothetical protein